MATGYTADIHDGKDVDFNTFVLTCTRAMGVAIMQRDEPLSTPLKEESEPSTYHQEALAKATADLLALDTIPLDEWERLEQVDRAEAIERTNESIKKAGEVRVRYASMLAQVEAWKPPTSEHENLKKFMREQLESSIEFDCGTSYLTIPTVKTAAEFKAERIASTQRSVDYHRKAWAEEQERTASRNKWVRDLRASLAAK